MTGRDGRISVETPADGVGLITIDRPAKRNAMTSAMVAAFDTAFLRFCEEEAVRAIVITGAGDAAFCAGHDLNEAAEGDRDHLYAETHMQVFLRPAQTYTPVIAAVNGAAYAGGFCLALHSDLRLAATGATFAVPGPRLGIVPIAGQSARLVHLLPPAVVNELVMCGGSLEAARAAALGFVNRVVERADLLPEALKMAEAIAAQSPFAVQSYKRIARESLAGNVSAADAMEYWLAMTAGHGQDVEEGLAAFKERRPPVFGQVKPGQK